MENKKKHGSRWFMATRPWFFPASAMPVLVTLAYLNWCGYEINWLVGVWALLNIVVFHAAGNTWSDYFDYKKGVDREDAIGGMFIVSGEFQPGEIKRLAWCLLACCCLAKILRTISLALVHASYALMELKRKLVHVVIKKSQIPYRG